MRPNTHMGDLTVQWNPLKRYAIFSHQSQYQFTENFTKPVKCSHFISATCLTKLLSQVGVRKYDLSDEYEFRVV